MFGQLGGQCGIGAPVSERIGGESFIRHIGNDKLIFDFKEGSGTTVRDKSREGNNGTFGAGAAAPTWKRNSLYFDGGDYVDLTGINHGISTGGFTFCVNSGGIPNAVMFFDQETVRLYIYVQTNVINMPGKVISDAVISISPLSLQITRDNSRNLECYVNGKAQKKAESLTPDFTYDGTSAMAFCSRYSFDTNMVTGTMYSFRILDKGLSGIECFQEYLANKFRGNN